MLYFIYNTEVDGLLFSEKKVFLLENMNKIDNIDSVCISHLIISIALYTRAGTKILVSL